MLSNNSKKISYISDDFVQYLSLVAIGSFYLGISDTFYKSVLDVYY